VDRRNWDYLAMFVRREIDKWGLSIRARGVTVD
jgi:hypothetical protein